mmetsp:Transcript_18987/g.30630  ORF Transcript_18987/g.30630 Transcript_18987/m.30630 type:complete len:90 (-) Transcript_18987:1160-1429(-)
MNQPMWLLWLAIVAILSDGGIEAAYPECGLKDDDFKIIYDEKSCTRVCDDCTGSGCNATFPYMVSFCFTNILRRLEIRWQPTKVPKEFM